MQWNEHKDILSPLKILAHSLMKKVKNINVIEALLCQSEGDGRRGKLVGQQQKQSEDGGRRCPS